MMDQSGQIPFFKMTGSGNDFIIIDNRNGILDADSCSELVRLACRRKLSVGADGFILIENDPAVDFKWRFFNADGSEAEMCGNGARCAARFAHISGIVDSPRMAFRTLAGIIEAEITGRRVKILVTPPRDLKMDVPLPVGDNIIWVHFINTGVPHVVNLLPDSTSLENLDIERLGRSIRHHPQFQPAGTNVNFAFVTDSHHLILRTYERGVEAETLACGTGSIAAALVGAAKGLLDSPVEVQTRSGEILSIHFHKTKSDDCPLFGDVRLEGDARVVYEGKLWDETLRQ